MAGHAGEGAGERGLWLGVLLLAATLFRLPPLVSANAINSDAAVVALQAMHLLRGELSVYLWGVDYQTVFDPAAVALGFALTGPSAYTVVAVQIVGHLAMLALAYLLLARIIGARAAALACLPLVFTPAAVNVPLAFAARQLCATVAMLAVFLLDRSHDAQRPRLALGVGAALIGVAVFLDMITLMLVPGLVLLAVLCTVDRPPSGAPGRIPPGSRGGRVRSAWRALGRLPPAVGPRLRAVAAGFFVGVLPLVALRVGAAGSPRVLHVSVGRLAGSARLLWGEALPWLVGTKVYVPGGTLYPQPWHAPWPFVAMAVLGAAALVGAHVAAVWLARRDNLSWRARRLGLAGAVSAAAVVGGFLFSSMPKDMWSTRYLAPMVWVLPLSLAPVAEWLGRRRLAVALAPWVLASLAGGWLSYGPATHGASISLAPRARLDDETALARDLRTRGIRYGAASYWLAYRLTFLFGEDPVVVPLDAEQDRYPPYRAGFTAARERALIFHPAEPRAAVDRWEAELRARGAHFERHQVGAFTYLVTDAALP